MEGKPVVLVDYIPLRVIVSVGDDPLEVQCAMSPDVLSSTYAVESVLDEMFSRAKKQVLRVYGRP